MVSYNVELKVCVFHLFKSSVIKQGIKKCSAPMEESSGIFTVNQLGKRNLQGAKPQEGHNCMTRQVDIFQFR